MNPTQQTDLLDNGLATAPGPVVPHSGMAGGVLGIALILIAWLWVQHRYYREETAIPHLGIIFLVMIYLSVWLIERGTRAAQNRWPGGVTDFLVI